MDEAPSAPSAAPPSSRRWRRDACRDRVRDRFGSPTRLTKQGAPAGSCLCLNVFPSRAVLPSRQRGHPVATRRAPVLVARAVPPKRAPSRGRGGSQLVSDRRSFGTWRATCRALLPTSSGDPTAREPVRFGRGQPWEPRLQAHPPSSKGGQPQRFPEPSGPTVTAAQPPTSRLAPSWGSRAGCPASTTPLTRAGQPPRRNQGAASRCAAAPRRLGAGQFAGTRPRWATRDEGR